MMIAEKLPDGRYAVDVSQLGWPQIHAFENELRGGQSVFEDAGGFMVRALKRLLGIDPGPDAEVVTYRDAVTAMLVGATTTPVWKHRSERHEALPKAIKANPGDEGER